MSGHPKYSWRFEEDNDGDLVFAFGKHEGELLFEVAEEDPGYLCWMLSTMMLTDDTVEAIEEALEAAGKDC